MSETLVKGIVGGIEFTLRMPAVAEFDQLKSTDSMATKCIVAPTGDELKAALRAKPGAKKTLGLALLRASGAVGPLEELEEADIEQAEADALVRFADVGPLHVVRFRSSATDFSITVVAREPDEAELNGLEKRGGLVAEREFIRRAVVHPVGADRKLDCTELDQKAPGFYRALTNFLSQKAGLSLDLELGEA